MELIEFLREELNETVDRISDLKSVIQKMEIDIDTSVAYSKNIKSRKDDTMNFFLLDSDEDSFNNREIDNLNSEVASIHNKLTSYREQLLSESEKLATIKDLIGRYSDSREETIIDFASESAGNIAELIRTADEIHDVACGCINSDIKPKVDMLLNSNSMIKSLINSDPQRAVLEIENNDNILIQIQDSIMRFDSEIHTYNSELSFKENFEILCDAYVCKLQNSDGCAAKLTYQFSDETEGTRSINLSKCLPYYKMLSCMLDYFVSRETSKFDKADRVDDEISSPMSCNTNCNKLSSSTSINDLYDSGELLKYNLSTSYNHDNDNQNYNNNQDGSSKLHEKQRKATYVVNSKTVDLHEFKVEHINYKSKSKLIFTLPLEYEYLKEDLKDDLREGLKEDVKEKSSGTLHGDVGTDEDENKSIISGTRLIRYYLNICNAYVKFKVGIKIFSIQVDINLY